MLVCFQKPIGQGPLPEYDYWQERESGLRILVEQLKSTNVVHIFEILHEGRSDIGERVMLYKDDLLMYYVLARDNVKFLSTILRHFKVIMHVK
jgi:dynein heavy chain